MRLVGGSAMTSGCAPADPFRAQVSVLWRGSELCVSHSYRAAVEPAEGGRGPLLVCLHGAYCNRGDFACIFACKALQRCGVVAFDLPGHGGSSKIPAAAGAAANFPAALEEMAEVVLFGLEALGLASAPCIVVGHSLGGAVGLLLSGRLPDLRSFVSLEGCLVASDTPPNGIASRWMRHDPSCASALDLFEDIAAASHLGRDPTGILHWRDAAEACGGTVNLLAVRMSGSLVSWSCSGKLPTYLDGLEAFHYVGGLGSGKLTPALLAALAPRRNCRLHAIGGAGHFLLLDAREATLRIIADVVQEVATAPSSRGQGNEPPHKRAKAGGAAAPGSPRAAPVAVDA